ncbi:helix-turn-helix transcriptional regulator [Bacillus gobiensis]|uniref:DUF6597 domain-containing transcriptional factor n=1 Tax=Bacillus gobiensis TaxID=1441095 RepID=UPI003D19D76E
MHPFRPLQPPAFQQEFFDPCYRYQEYAPSKNLEKYIACYWTINIRAKDKNKLHRVIPDGCVDIIFDLRSTFVSKGAFAAGVMPEYMVTYCSEDQSLFGIRFYIETAHFALSHPISSITGNLVFLEDIWGHETAFVWEEILNANRVEKIIQIVESKLKNRFEKHEFKSDGFLQTALNYMYAYKGNLQIRLLAEKISWSERSLRRTFQNELGISPKELLNIVRFQYLLQDLKQGSHSRFVDMALTSGYYDQPHLINSFKRYYGLSPSDIFGS